MHDRAMKRAIALTALVVGFSVAACGGRQSVASKSAAAYADAQKKGVPEQTTSQVEHAEHAEMAGMPGMEHATMTGGGDHSMAGMQHGAMQHESMPGMQHGEMQHAGMQHGSMQGMQHGEMAHGSMPGMQHGEMPGMQHGEMPGMQHTAPNPQVATVAEPPRSNSAIASVQPDATLRSDEFDAPAPAAESEAAKTASPHHHH